jgi:hypothetical protein
MRTTAAAAILAAVLAGCATPADAWLGEWSVLLDETRTPCDGGEPDDVPGSVLWRIEESPELGVFLAGECAIPLRVLTSSYAEFRVSTCASSFADGTPVTLRISGGSLTMDADGLGFTGSFSGRAETPTTCLDVRDEVTGLRL